MAKQYAMIRRPVESRILFLRSRKVILDSDLADLYRVTVKRLNQQVKRNVERFPKDFMFRLTPGENKLLRSQIATQTVDAAGGATCLSSSPSTAPLWPPAFSTRRVRWK
jgi:ORF6N domain